MNSIESESCSMNPIRILLEGRLITDFFLHIRIRTESYSSKKAFGHANLTRQECTAGNPSRRHERSEGRTYSRGTGGGEQRVGEVIYVFVTFFLFVRVFRTGLPENQPEHTRG